MRSVEDDGRQEGQDLRAEAGIEKRFGFTRLYPAQDRSNVDARARDHENVLHSIRCHSREMDSPTDPSKP